MTKQQGGKYKLIPSSEIIEFNNSAHNDAIFCHKSTTHPEGVLELLHTCKNFTC